jgi:predicted nuclease with TOPRIM domain
MSDDPTQNLPTSFEERVLAELAAIRQENAQLGARMASLEKRVALIDERLTSLEDKVDARLRETRPIWEGVQQRLTEIERGLDKLNRQFRMFVADAFELRSRVENLENEQAAREERS